MTAGQLLDLVTGRELDELLEYDALEPPVGRRDLEALFGTLTAMVCNASGNYKRAMRPEDFFPGLRPEGQEAGPSAEEKNRTRFALLALEADIALMNGKG